MKCESQSGHGGSKKPNYRRENIEITAADGGTFQTTKQKQHGLEKRMKTQNKDVFF